MKKANGKAAARAAIEGAQPATAMISRADIAPRDRTAGRFEMRAAGLFKLPDNDRSVPLWLSDPFDLLAETRDYEGAAWGLLLAFRDRDGALHELAVSRRALAGDGIAVRELLSDSGLSLNPAPPARQAFVEYLACCASSARARCVPRIGWHRIGPALVFVLPDAVVGEAPERVILQAEDRLQHAFHQAGTLEDWKASVGTLTTGNTRLVFAASVALAAPLMKLLGTDGGGFNLKGASRLGKSTALRVAASICGGEPGGGAGAFIRQWRATANGIEGVAAAHSDCVLPLDELGQMDAREAGETAYLLANGAGKTRAGRNGLARPPLRWQVMILSTGEEGIAERNAEAGKRTRAGQEVRLVDVPADAGAGFGLFECLHGAETAGAFAERVNDSVKRCYGAPLRAFLGFLAARLAEDEATFCAELRRRRDDLLRDLLPTGAGGQVRSVSSVFALVALAGEMAAETGIMPWPETDATAAAHACLRAWMAERGTTGSREDAQAVTALRGFLLMHGPSRFELWRDPASESQDEQDRPYIPPAERYRTMNRAGWRRWMADSEGRFMWQYYLTADAMGEALRGLNQREAIGLLQERGFLPKPDGAGKAAHALTPPGNAKVRLYKVAGQVFGADEGAL